MQTPSTIKDLQRFLASLDWEDMREQIQAEADMRLAIVGPVNAGKSTLFNLLEGRQRSATSAVPGTTKELIADWLGPFILIDTPGIGEIDGVDRADAALEAAQHATVIVLLLDAAAGVRQADRDLYMRLMSLGHPVIVAMNKIDLVGRDRAYVLDDARQRMGGVHIIPISARRGDGVATELMPAIFRADPGMGVAIGRALPAYRRQAAAGMVRVSAVTNAVIGVEPIPGLAIPLLLAGHVRLVLRIAAIYGEAVTAERARELLAAMAGGVLVRYLGGALAKFFPGPGWVVASVLAWVGTMAIGQATISYFEGGKQLSMPELRRLYRGIQQQEWRRLPFVRR
jgi:small GTP-binding protein